MLPQWKRRGKAKSTLEVQTPQLDRLARDGGVFDRHYNTTSICMASHYGTLFDRTIPVATKECRERKIVLDAKHAGRVLTISAMQRKVVAEDFMVSSYRGFGVVIFIRQVR